MLHRIVKLVGEYIRSVNERKRMTLSDTEYIVEIIVSAVQKDGERRTVINHINVNNALPETYSETIRNSGGQDLDFVAGKSRAKYKFAEDNLVQSFEAAKIDLYLQETIKQVTENFIEHVKAGAEAPEPETVKVKKPRVKKEKKTDETPA